MPSTQPLPRSISGADENRRFWPRWMLAVTIGEATGFAIPAGTAVVLALAGAPAGLVYFSMILAGTCEGVLLGLGQWIGFGRSIVPRAAWVGATAMGAAIAWSIGMLPSSTDMDFSAPFTLPLVIFLGSVLLLSIPTLQWMVLRRFGRRSVWWIPVNVGAWATGILWTLAPSPIVDETTPGLAVLGIYVLSGILMAATVAALSGVAAHRLVVKSTTNPVQPS